MAEEEATGRPVHEPASRASLPPALPPTLPDASVVESAPESLPEPPAQGILRTDQDVVRRRWPLVAVQLRLSYRFGLLAGLARWQGDRESRR